MSVGKIQGKITKMHPRTIERQKLENAPNQGHCFGFLGSQVESRGRPGAVRCSSPWLNLLKLCFVLHCEPETLNEYPWLLLLQKKKSLPSQRAVTVAHTEINSAQSPVTTGNVRACSKKRDRNNHRETFSLPSQHSAQLSQEEFDF